MKIAEFIDYLLPLESSSLDARLELFERTMCGVSLTEVDAPLMADIDYLRRAKQLSDTPVIGKKYITICIGLFASGIQLFDTTEMKTLTHIQQYNDYVKFTFRKDDGTLVDLPDDRLSPLSFVNTFLFSDIKTYNTFRTFIGMRYNKPLPTITI